MRPRLRLLRAAIILHLKVIRQSLSRAIPMVGILIPGTVQSSLPKEKLRLSQAVVMTQMHILNRALRRLWMDSPSRLLQKKALSRQAQI